MIGIIGAMDEEVEQIVAVMDIEREETKAQMTFKAGKLAGKDVVIVRSGIGKVTFSNVDVRRVSDEFNGGNKSSRALYREKIVTFLSISPFVKEIRNNRLCMDWQITEQQKINEK